MKKLFMSVIAIGFAFGAFAQDTEQKSAIVMKDGKVVVWSNGVATPLVKDTTFSGTTVMVDGTVKLADGTSVLLTDGDYLKEDGTIAKMDWKAKEEPIEENVTDSIQ